MTGAPHCPFCGRPLDPEARAVSPAGRVRAAECPCGGRLEWEVLARGVRVRTARVPPVPPPWVDG